MEGAARISSPVCSLERLVRGNRWIWVELTEQIIQIYSRTSTISRLSPGGTHKHQGKTEHLALLTDAALLKMYNCSILFAHNSCDDS